MPPPAASVDFRAPADPNSKPSFENGNPNFPSSFNAGCSPTGVGRAGYRAKPRLVKQRRSSKTVSSLPGDAGLSGFNNPFNNSSNVDSLDCHSNNINSNSSINGSCINKNVFGGHFGNRGFVFGVSNSSNGDNVAVAGEVGYGKVGNCSVRKEEFKFSVKGGECSSNGTKGENCEENGVAFSFSASGIDQGGGSDEKSGVEVGILEELKKLNIENNGTGGCGGEAVEGRDDANLGVSSSGDGLFVFKSGGVDSDLGKGESVVLGSEENIAKSNGVEDKGSSRFGSHSIDENVFVFGSSGNGSNTCDFSSDSSSFSAEVDGGRVKEDVLRNSFPFSSVGAEVGKGKIVDCSVSGEKKIDCSAASMPEEPGTSAPEFKLPGFDVPLTFSANISCEFGRKPEPSVKSQCLRDKKAKVSRGKAKHYNFTKQRHSRKPSPIKSVAQAKEAAECYSPMDFSPYDETAVGNEVPLDGQQATRQSEVESGITKEQPDLVFMRNRQDATISDLCTSFSANLNIPGGIRTQTGFNVSSDGQEKFAFTIQDPVSSAKRQPRKKYRRKPVPVAGRASKIQGSCSSGTSLSGKHDGPNSSVSASNGKHVSNANVEPSCKSAFNAAEKACDKWRRRGNEAYEKGDLSKAEGFYTWGVNSIPPGDASGVIFTPLVRCYSNRAATRMALHRVREAIQDCFMAVKLDPTFHRAQMRAANCYLQLGELEDAVKCFGKIVDSTNVFCVDRQVIISASEGIQKSQEVMEYINHATELLKHKTSEAAASALEVIAAGLTISSYSEKLLAMKAEALCMLRKHDEAIALCQETLSFAEKNFAISTLGNHEAGGSSLNVNRWRRRILCKCNFHLGKLESALELIEQQESGGDAQDVSDPLAVTIHELLRERSAGNIAFQSGKHAEAVEHYTIAISSSMESRPFAAICFCNRAAAHQALGHIADAISDCSIAIALDENYAKAVSRRATLHEMIRDYKQAATDLQRLASILEKHSPETKQSGSGNGTKELRQVKHRLSTMGEEGKRDIPLDLYLILGVNKTDPASEIKKAYRKAALRHHPDKAGQSLVRSDAGDVGRLWKDIAELVHRDSERLFKMIGEAYAVLSDPTKREEYDLDEEMRKALKENDNIRSASRRHSDYYYQGYPFERSSPRRNWQDGYRYSYSHKRW